MSENEQTQPDAAPDAVEVPEPDTGHDPSESSDDTDWRAEAERYKAEAEKYKKHSRKHEDRSKANATAAEERDALLKKVASAIGLAEDEKPDPAKVTAQLEAAQAVAWRNAVKLAVYRAAGKTGADPDALLDSVAFINSLDDITDDDPDDDGFAEKVAELVQAAVKDNPKYAHKPAKPPAPKKFGTDGMDGGTGGRGRSPSLSAAISRAMSNPP